MLRGCLWRRKLRLIHLECGSSCFRKSLDRSPISGRPAGSFESENATIQAWTGARQRCALVRDRASAPPHATGVRTDFSPPRRRRPKTRFRPEGLRRHCLCPAHGNPLENAAPALRKRLSGASPLRGLARGRPVLRTLARRPRRAPGNGRYSLVLERAQKSLLPRRPARFAPLVGTLFCETKVPRVLIKQIRKTALFRDKMHAVTKR